MINFLQTHLAVLGGAGLAAWGLYAARVVVIVALGISFSWIHARETESRFTHFSAAATVPAILASFLSADPSNVVRGRYTVQLATPVLAAQPRLPIGSEQAGDRQEDTTSATGVPGGIREFTPPAPTVWQEALLGLLGIRPKLPEYFVELAHEPTPEHAIGRRDEIQSDIPNADLQVFKLSARVDGWVVTHGGQVPLREAVELLEQVVDDYPAARLRRLPTAAGPPAP